MKDTIREAWFVREGWHYEYQESTPISSIVADSTAKAQIRLGEEIDTAHATRLGLAYSEGAKLPAIILARIDDRLILADGIHRVAGARHASLKALDAYIVTNVENEKLLERLRRSVNAIGGKGFDTTQAIEQGVALVDIGWSCIDAAKTMHVSQSSIQKVLRIRKAHPKIVKACPSIPETAIRNLTADALDSIGSLQREDVLRQLANIVVRCHIPTLDIKEMASEGRKAVTDEAAAVLLKKWQSLYAGDLQRPVRFTRGKGANEKMLARPAAVLERGRQAINSGISKMEKACGFGIPVGDRKTNSEFLKTSAARLLRLADDVANGRHAAARVSVASVRRQSHRHRGHLRGGRKVSAA